MNIFTPDFNPPQSFTNERFTMFPTDVSFYESDYIAVMKSRDSLRVWSQSSWPEDDFTVDQNREDLQQHVDDNKAHSAYGYMIYSLDKKTCFGSLYVNPLKSVEANYILNEKEKLELRNFDARIDCWLTQGLERELEAHILSDIREWLRDEWKIRAFFAARIGMTRRMEVYQSMGLTMRLNLRSQISSMSLLLFG